MVKRWWLVCLGTLACNEILGIDEARLARDGSGAAAGVGAGPSSGGTGVGATGGSGDAPGSGGDAGMAGSPGPQTLCETYCATVQTNCLGADAQYVNLESCLETCARLPEGTEGDTQINTVHCRLSQAEDAALEPFFACTFAGPAGSGECDSNCESLCTLAMQACDPTKPEENAGAFYADKAACMTDCEQVPDLGTYTTDPAVQQYSGGHVQCRIYHVISAFGEPDSHCAHVKGVAPCADPDGGT